ncbi:MAG: hypothetical protein ACI4BA_03880 [Prevotella sp.]
MPDFDYRLKIKTMLLNQFLWTPTSGKERGFTCVYGRKVQRMDKGIYIHNGKKIMNLK